MKRVIPPIRIALLLVLWGMCAAAGAEDDQDEIGLPPAAVKTAAALVHCSGPADAKRLTAELFSTPNAELLGQLKSHANDGIALAAAWEEAKIGSKSRRRNAQAIARFIGFAEGRLKTRVPDWWEETITRRHLVDDHQYWPLDDPGQFKWPYQQLKLGDRPVWVPNAVSLSDEEGRVVIRQGGARFSLPQAMWNEQIREASVGARVTPTHCWLAPFADRGAAHPLLCFETSSGKLLWQSDVWALSNQGHKTSSQTFQWLEIIPQAERVLVIGSGLAGVYIEGFDRQSGRNLFRFASHNQAGEELDS